MAVKPTKASEAEPTQPGLTTRDLSRFMTFYLDNVRKHSKAECVGVIRQIQRLVEGGTPAEDIALALENYAADPWRKRQDPRLSKHIRSFFTAETVKEWLTPKPTKLRQVDPLARLQDFRPDTHPKPAIPLGDEPEDIAEDF